MAGPTDSSSKNKGISHVLFVQVGVGADQHGQDVTKAAVRACRNAIEFNSIPSICKIVPGGFDGLKVRVELAIPTDKQQVDVEQVRKAFPYGKLLPIEYQQGGMIVHSGMTIPDMGDKSDEMLIVNAAITVGY